MLASFGVAAFMSGTAAFRAARAKIGKYN